LLLKCLAATGQLNPGDCVDLDFDHQFIAADKKDAKYSYKKADGYFPGVASIGGVIAGVENRDGNANVRFHQADTLERLFNRLEKHARVVVRNFRADCGSFSEEILVVVSSHCEHFYIRASNCQSRYVEFMEHEDWTETDIGGRHCGVTSLRFGAMLPDMNL
ncbi:MAG TPA: IS1380 family transposase, partial [Rikenellaceae bacterium]|nr:IS1380 family transposase [Rikenellaceae bacterium]